MRGHPGYSQAPGQRVRAPDRPKRPPKARTRCPETSGGFLFLVVPTGRAGQGRRDAPLRSGRRAVADKPGADPTGCDGHGRRRTRRSGRAAPAEGTGRTSIQAARRGARAKGRRCLEAGRPRGNGRPGGTQALDRGAAARLRANLEHGGAGGIPPAPIQPHLRVPDRARRARQARNPGNLPGRPVRSTSGHETDCAAARRG